MRWIRQHIHSCAWLALTALAIHLVLTFGHVHAGQFSPASMATAPIAAVDAQTGGDADGASEERYRALRAHHSCAICASIGLLGTLVLPVVHVLAQPRAIAGARKPNPTDIGYPRELRSSSRARAPPSA
jgi:hypothetical protein